MLCNINKEKKNDPCEDSGSQRKAEWEAMELGNCCSLKLEMKIFPQLEMYWDCIVGILEVEFHHIVFLV